jgi:Tfp pilus assembly protein PilE
VNYKKGFSVVEIIIASAIVTLVGVAITSSLLAYINISMKNSRNVQTALLFEETAEALQFMRDQSWSTNIAPLAKVTPYYLIWNGESFVSTSTAVLHHNLYSRTFTLHEVKRDGSDAISDSGSIDPDTLRATISVSWLDGDNTESRTTDTLIHNTYEN